MRFAMMAIASQNGFLEASTFKNRWKIGAVRDVRGAKGITPGSFRHPAVLASRQR
jgi:hypothetical protein